MPPRADMLMPVTDDHALRQFEIEALRSINRNLERLYERSDEHGQTLQNIDVRLTRIESNSVSDDMVELKVKVDKLESAEDRRQGARNFLEWMLRYGPILLGFIVLAVIVLAANGKLP